MKKVFYVLIPVIVAIILFGSIIFLLSHNKNKGALQVTSVPDSKVYLNDKLLGQTPLCECDLKNMIDEGSYTIRLVPIKGNFEPFEQKISISAKSFIYNRA